MNYQEVMAAFRSLDQTEMERFDQEYARFRFDAQIVLQAYRTLNTRETEHFDANYTELQNERKRESVSEAAAKVWKAIQKTFDRAITLEALRGLKKHLEVKRRTYERGSLDYREMTTEVERVRDLITLLELDPADSGL